MSRPLRILIDANPLVGKKSGVGHFSYRLIEALADSSEDIEITAYYFNFLGLKPKPDLPNTAVVRYKVVRFLPTKLINILHRLNLQLPVEFFLGFKRYDFMLFPNFVAVPSLRRTPYAPVVHDLGFVDHPEYLTPGNQQYLARFVAKSVRKSSFVATISDFTKQRIIKTYGLPESSVVILPIPYEPSTVTGRISPKIRQITTKPYLLFVGTIEPRKNVDGLIQAFAATDKVVRSKYRLVLAGGWGWKTENIQKALESNKHKIDVVLTGYVTDAERELLYQQAEVVCMPSHYEGFGMQLLEAVYYKKKLLLSDIPPFKEVAGNMATYTDIHNPAQFAKDIEKILAGKQPSKITIPKWSWRANTQKLIRRVKAVLKSRS